MFIHFTVAAQTCTCAGVNVSEPFMSGSGSDMGSVPALEAAGEYLLIV